MSSPSPVQASTSASSLDNVPRETAEPSQARHVPEPPKNRKTSSFKAKQEGVITKQDSRCDFEAEQSRMCLDINNYDKSKCQAYFDAYKECRDIMFKGAADERTLRNRLAGAFGFAKTRNQEWFDKQDAERAASRRQ